MNLEPGRSEYEHRFASLWTRAESPADWKPVYEQLLASYSEPWRHYHSFRHIAHCLREFDLAQSLMASADAVQMALWFHDAVYVPGAHDNERRSADYFSRLSQGRFPSSFEDQVRGLILITEHVKPPTTQAERYMVDIDLSPFGIPWEHCLEDSKRVRRELDMIPDRVYFQTNIQFLQALTRRPHMYHTEHFRKRYERSARENIGRLLRQIKATGGL